MVGADLAAVVFGLASALSWGADDFSGGLATKRAPVFGILAVGHTVGLLLLIALALVWGEPLPSATELYPASTVLLAALLLGERVMRTQVVGIMAALTAIALIAS